MKDETLIVKSSSLLSTNESIKFSDNYTESFRFPWHDNENQQGLILGSYFWGYTAFQVPAGRMAEKFGSKWVIGCGVLFSGILTLLTPVCADLGLVWFIICRLFIGMFHATILSSCYCIFNAWVPEKDKVRAITWVNVAFEVGGMTTLFLSGLISSEPAMGWEYCFYLYGLVAFLWFIPYVFLVYSDPSQNSRVSNYERKLLEQSKTIEHSKEDFSKKWVRVPPKLSYKKVLTSAPVWASCIAKFTSNFGYYLLALKMSSFLKEVYDVPLAKNGLLSAAQYGGVLLSKLICLKLAGYLQKKNLMSLTNLRKTFQFFSMTIPAFCFLMVPLKGDNQNIVTALIFIGMFGHGLQCGGDAPIISEFAKDLAGSIFGFTNMFACFDGIISPIVVGFFVQNCSDIKTAWDYIFYLATILNIIGITVFLIWASAEPQSWAVATYKEVDPTMEKKKKKDKKDINQSLA